MAALTDKDAPRLEVIEEKENTEATQPTPNTQESSAHLKSQGTGGDNDGNKYRNHTAQASVAQNPEGLSHFASVIHQSASGPATSSCVAKWSVWYGCICLAHKFQPSHLHDARVALVFGSFCALSVLRSLDMKESAPVSSLVPAKADPQACDRLALSSWGLPDVVLQRYREHRITRMFDWQAECLCTGNVLSEYSSDFFEIENTFGCFVRRLLT